MFELRCGHLPKFNGLLELCQLRRGHLLHVNGFNRMHHLFLWAVSKLDGNDRLHQLLDRNLFGLERRIIFKCMCKLRGGDRYILNRFFFLHELFLWAVSKLDWNDELRKLFNWNLFGLGWGIFFKCVCELRGGHVRNFNRLVHLHKLCRWLVSKLDRNNLLRELSIGNFFGLGWCGSFHRMRFLRRWHLLSLECDSLLQLSRGPVPDELWSH